MPGVAEDESGNRSTQSQCHAKYLMFSSQLNLIRPPAGRTISICFLGGKQTSGQISLLQLP